MNKSTVLVRRQELVPDIIKELLKDYSKEKKDQFFIEVFKVSLKNSRLLALNRNILNELILAVTNNKEEYTIDCSVLEEDGKKILIIKRDNVLTDPIIQILPADELLNVVSDALVTYPRITYDALYTLLGHRYSIPIINKIHYGLVSKISNYYESRLQCNIITINAKSDNCFNFLLIAVDELTNYAYFRPLSKVNADELAMELLKLFMDIGIPHIVDALNMVVLFKDTFKYLTTLNFIPISEVRIDFRKQLQKVIFSASQLIVEIEKWFSETQSKDWAIWIGYAQWMLNNQISPFEAKLLFASSTDSKVSPYYSHFGYKPNLCSIFCEFEDEFDGTYMSNEVMCTVCDTITYVPVYCNNCNKSVHSTCSVKTLIKDDTINIIKVMCNLCIKNE